MHSFIRVSFLISVAPDPDIPCVTNHPCLTVLFPLQVKGKGRGEIGWGGVGSSTQNNKGETGGGVRCHRALGGLLRAGGGTHAVVASRRTAGLGTGSTPRPRRKRCLSVRSLSGLV
eukprot:Sspe_Gene.57321::Locus_31459_Transcript_1_2_Confidence_0.667_Length_988::g.57321::m.57321